jgi:cytochrome c-type biogenesis protein CcmH/NrfG
VPKAIAADRTSVQLNPQAAPGWVRLGEALAQNGNAPEAEKTLKRALELNPSSYPAHRALARMHFDEGHPDRAVEAWGQALKLQPDRGEAHEGLAEALLAARRPADARLEAEQAKRLGRNVDPLLKKIDAALAAKH